MSVIQNTTPQTMRRPQTMFRRDFIKAGLSAATVLAVVELGGLTWLYLQPRAMEGALGGEVLAGAGDSFPLGSVTPFPEGRFYLVRTHEGGFLAVSRRCPHLGCTVTWQGDPRKFFCPCHASHFDMLGNPESAPAPRALDTFAISVHEGDIIVDTSHLQPRQQFESGQLTFQ